MLHVIEGKNRYWGPAAIATITGVTTDQVSRMIRADSVRRQVMHTEIHELSRCLYQLGFQINVEFDGRDLPRLPTVARWLKMREQATGIYLVDANGRWVVARGRKIADAGHRQPVFLSEYKRRRCRVCKAWLVEPVQRSV